MGKSADQIVLEMYPWWGPQSSGGKNPKIIRPSMRAAAVADRTPEQRAWDSAIMACAEFLRRLDDVERTVLFKLMCNDLPEPPQ